LIEAIPCRGGKRIRGEEEEEEEEEEERATWRKEEHPPKPEFTMGKRLRNN
jgi:hypothetical protein